MPYCVGEMWIQHFSSIVPYCVREMWLQHFSNNVPYCVKEMWLHHFSSIVPYCVREMWLQHFSNIVPYCVKELWLHHFSSIVPYCVREMWLQHFRVYKLGNFFYFLDKIWFRICWLTITKIWTKSAVNRIIFKWIHTSIFGDLSYITYTNKQWKFERAKSNSGPNILYLNMAN